MGPRNKSVKQSKKKEWEGKWGIVIGSPKYISEQAWKNFAKKDYTIYGDRFMTYENGEPALYDTREEARVVAKRCSLGYDNGGNIGVCGNMDWHYHAAKYIPGKSKLYRKTNG